MSTGERPAKRTRQACDPCRRKKSRCPGEKPTCSYCARLGQQCTYTDDGLNRRQSIGETSTFDTPPRLSYSIPPRPHGLNTDDTSQRLSDLEAKLSEVIVALHESRQQNALAVPSPVPVPRQLNSPTVRQTTQMLAESSDLSGNLIQQAAQLYLSYCHCQPLPLFVPDEFAGRLPSQDEEVILAVLALALRFSTAASRLTVEEGVVDAYSEKARFLIQQRLNQGPIELSTLQTLCLLSLMDFYNGNSHRASMYASLAFNICKSSGLATSFTSDNNTNEERLRCFWSIVLIQRLHPNISGPFHISFDEETIPSYPKSSPRPIDSRRPTRINFDNRASDHNDLGIVAYAIQLTEVWYKVTKYAHRRASAGPHPPWSPKSEYVGIIAHQMDGETAMPYAMHRFKPVKFEERSSEEIFQHRGYWGPWLFTQILYHTIICVLNHPLLLSLRLRSFRVASIPEIWLQHTDDLISQHSQWVILIIDLLDTKGFLVSDPFLAHCVAIVATIHLQQSFGGDSDVRQVKKENFEKCLRFCQKIGERWPYIEQLARKLQDFERVVRTSYHNSAASRSDDRVFIDLSLFWEILESANISDSIDANGLKLGQSLNARSHFETVTEEFNTQLLPEPARVAAAGTPVNGNSVQQMTGVASDNIIANNSQQFPSNDDFAVLAQSYFAQGQDFVGNMDDWWLMEDSAQPL